MRLGITGQLATTLSSTNPCESMIEIVRYTQRNVKRWQERRRAQALKRDREKEINRQVLAEDGAGTAPRTPRHDGAAM
jgi:hypothetical protein